MSFSPNEEDMNNIGFYKKKEKKVCDEGNVPQSNSGILPID